ncbi:hypothetical protein ACP70R_042045 [Stipagrostis hirtigluma subsp. patula]
MGFPLARYACIIISHTRSRDPGSINEVRGIGAGALGALPAIDQPCGTGYAGDDIDGRTPKSEKSNDIVWIGGISRRSQLVELGDQVMVVLGDQVNCSSPGVGQRRPSERCGVGPYLLASDVDGARPPGSEGGPAHEAASANTCAPVAVTVAVGAKHRFLYGFPWTPAEAEHLIMMCKNSGIWKPENGARITKVLGKVRDLGGVPVIDDNPDVNKNPELCPRLRLTSWKKHKCAELGPKQVATLLHRGPCVAKIYHNRGDKVVFHAVVCFGYRHAVDCFGYRLRHEQVFVLDNQEDNGPWHWINLERIHTIYTLKVDCLKP